MLPGSSNIDLAHNCEEVLSALPMVVAQVDLDFRIRAVNRSESRVFRQAPAPGSRLEEVFRGRTVGAIATLIDRAQRSGTAEGEIDTGSELFWVSARRLEEESLTLLVFQERTNLTRAEQALVDLVKERSSFLASVSSELQTPLTAVLGYASLLADPNPDLDEDARSALVQGMTDPAWDLVGFLEDLLAVARAEIGELRMGRVPVNLSANVAQVLESMGGRGGSVTVTGDRSITGVGDPAGFRQIVRNLLSNALVHGAEPINVEVALNEADVLVRITDRGPGVPVGLAESMFDQYVAGSDLYAQGRVGIGLWISRELAGLMGGRLTYKRESGETVFQATLPHLESV